MHQQCGALSLDDSDWPQLAINQLPQNQALCIRVGITVDEHLAPNPAIFTQMLAARSLYFDGRLIAQDGKPAAQATAEQPGPVDSLHLLPDSLLTPGEHLLAVQLSNFHIGENISNWFYTLGIVDYAQAAKRPLSAGLPAMFFIGALVLVSIFFQLLFWQYQRHAGYQVFSLQCLFGAALLFAEHYRNLFGYNYDWHLCRMHWVMFLTFFGMLLIPVFYLLFYRMKRLPYWLTGLVTVMTLGFIIDPRYDAKSFIMFIVTIVFSLLINLLAARHKQQGAYSGSIMFILLLAAFILLPVNMVYSIVEQWFAFIYFVIILAISSTLISEMKSNRAKALTSARLETELLRRNLQPHFLMNSLMLVIEWIEHKPKAAVAFVQSLSEELRMLVQFSRETVIELDKEINLCRRHLEIMSQRYCCHYQLKIDGETNGINIPPAVLHSQIENAFNHNKIPDGAIFELSISTNGNKVTLQLLSPYRKRNNKTPGTGTGEDYIKARLSEYFGTDHEYLSEPSGEQWLNRIRFNKD